MYILVTQGKKKCSGLTEDARKTYRENKKRESCSLTKDNLKVRDFFGYFVKTADQYNVRGPYFQCMTGKQAGRSPTASGNLSLLST